jgi:hypothetical protein
VGGSGVYQWQFGPGGVQSGGSNANVSATYGTLGTKAVTVTSAGKTGRCTVTVLGTPQVVSNVPGVALQLEQVVRNVNTGSQSDAQRVTVGPGETIRVSLTLIPQVSMGALVVRTLLPLGLVYIPQSTIINGDQSFTGDVVGAGAIVGDLGQDKKATLTFLARAQDEATGTQSFEGAVQSSVFSGPNLVGRALTPISSGGTLGSGGTYGTYANQNGSAYSSEYTYTGESGQRIDSGAGTGSIRGVGGVATGPGDITFVALVVASIASLLYVSYTYSRTFIRRRIRDASERDRLDFRP